MSTPAVGALYGLRPGSRHAARDARAAARRGVRNLARTAPAAGLALERLPGLLGCYLSGRVSGELLAADTFDRSRNLLAAANPLPLSGVTAPWGTFGAGVTVTAPADGDLRVTTPGTVAGEGTSHSSSLAVVEGQTYTFAVDLSGTGIVYPAFRWGGAGNALIGTSYGAEVTLTATARRAYVTATAPPGAQLVTPRVITSYARAPQAATLDVARFQLEAGAVATPFLWGSTSNLGTSGDTGSPAWRLDLGSSWGIISGAAQSGTGTVLASVDTSALDVDVRTLTVVTTTGAPNAGPAVRVASGQDYLFARYDPSAHVARVYKSVGGTATVVSEVATPVGWSVFGAVVEVTLRVVGDTVTGTATSGGQTVTLPAYTITDAVLRTGTRQGLRTPTAGSRVTLFEARTPPLADGDPVGLWPDVSGNGRHAVQATASARPRYRSANPNLLGYNSATGETDTTGIRDASSAAAPTFAVDTSLAVSGRQSVAITATAAGTVNVRSASANDGAGTVPVPVTPGRVYAARVAAYTRASHPGTVYLLWYGPTGSYLSSSFATFASSAVGGWTERSVVGPAPAGAAYAAVRIDHGGCAVGEVVNVDNLAIVDVTPVWSPGGIGGNLLAAAASLPDPASTAGPWTANANGTLALIGGRVTYTATANGQGQLAGGGAADRVSTPQGSTVYASAVVYAAPGTSVTLELRWWDASSPTSTGTTSTLGPTITVGASGSAVVTIVATVPSNNAAAAAILRVNTSTLAVGQTFAVTQAFVSLVTAPVWVQPVQLDGAVPRGVQFDGLDDSLATVDVPHGTAHTLYLVVSPDTYPADARPLSWRTSAGASTGPYTQTTPTSQSASAKHTDGVFIAANVGATPAGAPRRVVTMRYTGGTVPRINVNGTAGTPQTGTGYVPDGASAPLSLGAGYPTVLPAAGAIHAVLVFDIDHDDATRQRVERELGRRYGIAVA